LLAVQFIGSSKVPGKLAIITELVAGGNVAQVVYRNLQNLSLI